MQINHRCGNQIGQNSSAREAVGDSVINIQKKKGARGNEETAQNSNKLEKGVKPA